MTTCIICRTSITQVRNGGRRKYCPACKKERIKELNRNHMVKYRRRAAEVGCSDDLPDITEAAENHAIIIAEGPGLERLAGAVVIQAVRDAKRTPAAVRWLTSQAAQIYLDVLNIHPDEVRSWVRGGMKAKGLRI